MRDLERVRYVTENYEQLRGLRRVPYHLALLLSVLLTVSYGGREGAFDVRPVQDALLFGAYLVAPWLYFYIGTFYESRYGRVRSRWRVGFPLGRVLLFAFVVVVLTAVAETFLDLGGSWAFREVAVVVGCFVVAAWFSRWWDSQKSRYAIHWLVLSILAPLASLLPLLSPFLEIDPALFLVAIYLSGDTVGGTIDHLLLVRTLKSVPEENDGAIG